MNFNRDDDKLKSCDNDKDTSFSSVVYVALNLSAIALWEINVNSNRVWKKFSILAYRNPKDLEIILLALR